MQLTKDLLTSNLSNKNIDGIDSLKGSACTKLDLSGNKLKSVSELSSLPLTWLNLCKNQINQFPFENFPLLSMLNLGQNDIEELKQVSRCKRLKALILNNNRLQKAIFTDSLPLESLVLSHNEISDFNGSGLEKLRQLSLSYNQLFHFPDLKANSKLRQLRLNGNQIVQLPKDKDSFPPWLEILDLGNNQIEKLSSIKGLMHCTRLRNLNLKGNPVCQTPQYKEALCALIPTLRILDGQPLNPKKKHDTDAPKEDESLKEESEQPFQKKRKAIDMEILPKDTLPKEENGPVELAKNISGVIKVITKKTKTAIDPSNLIVESAEIPGWD